MQVAARCIAALCLSFCALGVVNAQSLRSDILFQFYQETAPGESVFVVGSLPELGAWDNRLAVKMESSQYPVWRVRVQLPTGRPYSYRLVKRNSGAGELGDLFNFTYLTPEISVAPHPPAGAVLKSVVVENTMTAPTIYFRARGALGPYASAPMEDIGNGVNPGEVRWGAFSLPVDGDGIEFLLLDEDDSVFPEEGTISAALDDLFVREGEVYDRVPPDARSPAQLLPNRTYHSDILGEDRTVRILLPRDYGAEPGRRYPVLYMHDGQGLFGTGRTWMVDTTVPELTSAGVMREIIVVGIDNTGFDNRFRDYVPDGNSSSYGTGMASNYTRFIRDELKPQIDAEFLTLTSENSTGTMGSSLGALCAMYQGWEFGDTFRRVGALSGAWPFSTNFNITLDDEGPSLRDLKVYMDSGDAGLGADNFEITKGIRDTLLARSTFIESFAIEGNLRYRVGFGDEHDEYAWARRLPLALEFLYPAQEDAQGLKNLEVVQRGDADRDHEVRAEDLYAYSEAPGDDWDLDGQAGGAGDFAWLFATLRAGELDDALAPSN